VLWSGPAGILVIHLLQVCLYTRATVDLRMWRAAAARTVSYHLSVVARRRQFRCGAGADTAADGRRETKRQSSGGEGKDTTPPDEERTGRQCFRMLRFPTVTSELGRLGN